MTAFKFKVGELQASGLETYVFDPAVVEGNEAIGEPQFPGELNERTLTVTNPELAVSILTDAANSADDDKDAQLRDALTSLASRVLKKAPRYSRNPAEVVTASGREAVDVPSRRMVAFMEANRDRIEKATGLKITQANEKPFGCGGFGCAYATNDKRWIIKVGYDASEAALVKSVMDMRSDETGGDGSGPSTYLPGVAFFHGIWMRPDQGGRTMFVIVRENVQPFSEDDVLALDWFGAKGSEHPEVINVHGTSALNLAQNFASDFYDAKDDHIKARKAVNGYLKWVDVVREDMPLVADTMEDFFLRGIVLRDVHDRNVGYTLMNWGKKYRPKGSVIIFDLGFTPTTLPAKGYSKLNPALSEEQATKIMGRESIRSRSAEKAVIDTSRSPVAPRLISTWATVQIPRLQ